jgi:two-component system, NarL family, sensor histidine kinase UhpB
MASKPIRQSRLILAGSQTFWPRSLHGRLVLIPSALLLLGLLGTIGVIFSQATGRIDAEVTSSVQLGHDLAVTALRNVADAASKSAAFAALAQDLPSVRHVEFGLAESNGTVRGAIQPGTDKVVTQHVSALASLLAPPPIVQSFPIVVRAGTVGRLIVQSNPTDEINEIIGELQLFSLVLFGLGLLAMGGLLMTVRQSLRPLQSLMDGLDRLKHGDYRPIADIPVAELARVARQFDLFAASLQRMISDNRLLVDRLLSMQDHERKEVAVELHDQIGPVLYGIRAEAACIMRAEPHDTDSFARAQSISKLTDGTQRVNYRLLERLRPLILEQMGLFQALRQLLSTWQTRCPDITWSLDVPAGLDNPDEIVALTLYRATQEAITNAVRHAQAARIDIRLAREPAGGLLLTIRDNGRGLADSFHYGFGLLGMTERVRQIGGSLSISNARPGVLVAIAVPTYEQQTVEMVHADSAD